MKKQQYRKKILILGLVAGLAVPVPAVPATVVYDLPDTPFDKVDIDRLPTARLTVETEPAGARVRNLSITPAHKNGMALAPGTYRIEVSAQGYDTREENIILKRGDNRLVKITLLPPPPPPEPERTYTDTTTGMEFVYVPGGCFTLGDTFGEGYGDEKPDKGEVCVKAFYLGKYEVTIDQFRKYLQESGNEDGVDWSDDDCPIKRNSSYSLTNNRFGKSGKQPMVEVSWKAAVQMASYLSEKTGKTYRLPSEAQWEYAASWRPDGSKARFGNGKDIADPQEINFDGSSSGKKSYSKTGIYRKKTVPVDSFSPNALGLYNMSGNVWEWCQDTYHSSYKGGPKDGSAWESGGEGSNRVIRGGSWIDDPRDLRAANRDWRAPDGTYNDLGFRLVLPVH